MIKGFIHEDNDEQFLVANTFILGKGGQDCIVFDCGDRSDTVPDYCKANFKKVLGILITHAHFDHIRGISHFLSCFNNQKIPVYIHEDDYEMLMNTDLNGGVEIDFDPILVKDDQILTFDSTNIKVIHTPFHTPGSVCYLSEEDNALFTGDTLFKGSIGRSDLPLGDSTKVEDSLKKFETLSDMLVCYPGHGPVTNLGSEKKNNPYLKKE